jgi:hypothetical protein
MAREKRIAWSESPIGLVVLHEKPDKAFVTSHKGKIFMAVMDVSRAGV